MVILVAVWHVLVFVHVAEAEVTPVLGPAIGVVAVAAAGLAAVHSLAPGYISSSF